MCLLVKHIIICMYYERNMNEVFGIVLLLDALFITILYSRKDRVEKISKWGKRTVVFLIVVLVIIDGYFLIGDCDNFYVFSGKQAIQSYDDSLENDNQQTQRRLANKLYAYHTRPAMKSQA